MTVITKQVANDDPLFDQLRALRMKLAQEAGVPPFVVFSDKTLRDMAARMPITNDEFLEVNGVGLAKLERYGEAFMEEIKIFSNAKCIKNIRTMNSPDVFLLSNSLIYRLSIFSGYIS